MKREYEIAILWRAFPLHPDTPEEGLLLEQLFSGYPLDIKGMMRSLKKTASDLGLPLGDRERTYNSRLAQELGLWAESKNKGDLFHNAVFKSYFVEGKNIAKISVLLEIAAFVGLSKEEAKEVLETRSFKQAVDVDWSLSLEKSITAVPTFVIQEDKLVGAQPYEILEKFLKVHGVSRRSTESLKNRVSR